MTKLLVVDDGISPALSNAILCHPFFLVIEEPINSTHMDIPATPEPLANRIVSIQEYLFRPSYLNYKGL